MPTEEDTVVSRPGEVNAAPAKPAPKKSVKDNPNMTPDADGLLGSEGVYGAAGVTLSDKKVVKLRNGITVENQ